MPAITPGYLYTFIAILAVSSLLVFSFVVYANTLRGSSEVNQLRNLMDNIAAKSTELLTLTMTTNATAEAYIQMPTIVGDKQYWLQIRNDSTKTWLEAGFGNTLTEGTDLHVYLPQASANGSYISGYGSAHLRSHLDANIPHISLESLSQGD